MPSPVHDEFMRTVFGSDPAKAGAYSAFPEASPADAAAATGPYSAIPADAPPGPAPASLYHAVSPADLQAAPGPYSDIPPDAVPEPAPASGYQSLNAEDLQAAVGPYSPVPADGSAGSPPASGYNSLNSLDVSAVPVPPAPPAAPPAGGDAAGAAAPPKPKRTHAKVEPAASPTGMKSKSVSDSYAGEHNQVAWRKDMYRQPADETRLTTALHTPEQVAANTLQPQADGSFQKGDGTSVAGQSVNYAMDDTGKMVAAADAISISKRGADGNAEMTTDLFSGPNLRKGLAAMRDDPTARVELTHHSSALGGEDVMGEDGAPLLDKEGRTVKKSKPAASAGRVQFDFFGKIVEISNASGHYKPTVDFLMQAVEHLVKQGAFFTEEVTGPDGKALDRSGKPFQLYEATQAKLEDAKRKAAQAADLSQRLAAAEEAEQPKLDKQLTALTAELNALTPKLKAAQAMLGKLGVAPAMRIRKDAKVSFMDVDHPEELTGEQLHHAPVKQQGVQDFLTSGGDAGDGKGGKAKAAKDAMLAELREKTAKRRQAADGPDRPDEPSAPIAEEEIDAALAGVAPRAP